MKVIFFRVLLLLLISKSVVAEIVKIDSDGRCYPGQKITLRVHLKKPREAADRPCQMRNFQEQSRLFSMAVLDANSKCSALGGVFEVPDTLMHSKFEMACASGLGVVLSIQVSGECHLAAINGLCSYGPSYNWYAEY